MFCVQEQAKLCRKHENEKKKDPTVYINASHVYPFLKHLYSFLQ